MRCCESAPHVAQDSVGRPPAPFICLTVFEVTWSHGLRGHGKSVSERGSVAMWTIKQSKHHYNSGVIVVYPLPRLELQCLDGFDPELLAMIRQLPVRYGRIPHSDKERCKDSWYPDAVSGFHMYSVWTMSAQQLREVRHFFQFGIRAARTRDGEATAVAAWVPQQQLDMEHATLELWDLANQWYVDIYLALASCMLVWSPTRRQPRHRNTKAIAAMIHAARQSMIQLDHQVVRLQKEWGDQVIVNLVASMMACLHGNSGGATDAGRTTLFVLCACIYSGGQLEIE